MLGAKLAGKSEKYIYNCVETRGIKLRLACKVLEKGLGNVTVV